MRRINSLRLGDTNGSPDPGQKTDPVLIRGRLECDS